MATRNKREHEEHRYEQCADEDCPRFGCRAYKAGLRKGYQLGFEAGHAAGYAEGYAAGHAAADRAHAAGQ